MIPALEPHKRNFTILISNLKKNKILEDYLLSWGP